jgi:hypothetical protein
MSDARLAPLRRVRKLITYSKKNASDAVFAFQPVLLKP